MNVTCLSLLVVVSLMTAATAATIKPLRQQRRLATCPSVSPVNSTSFDIDKWIAKSWYIQKQQVTPYQSENDLYCVLATYNKRDDGFIQVLNYGNRGRVGGEIQEPNPDGIFTALCAQQVNAGELRVGPCFLNLLASVTSGPYWVLAVDTNYTWAIVSGGAPDQFRETVNGINYCTTKTSSCFIDTNGSGLWLFSRDQIASNATIAAMEARLTALGIYKGDLKSVPHANCTYPSYIKL